ncbi:unnamed protein product [Agarophyton chilense]|eukprot:gb/GEZJ01001731.1/.p1 GENE.gb/GEZJ01001731.1/~~gb/GEZJ01001731.1/.p1  ORF type:complete len:254 (+),score=38.69 gb/GEZJ01001731.1/:192-953(+)
MDMFSRLPVLRIKRKHTENNIDALQIRVNAKRRRTQTYDEDCRNDTSDGLSKSPYVNVTFRRVQLVDEAEQLLARSDTRLIDVPSHVLRKGEQRLPDQVLCNGTPMHRVELHSPLHHGKELEPACYQRVAVQDDSQMYDIFTLESDGTAYDRDTTSPVPCIDADDISLFDDEDDQSLPYTSDEDAKTVDYPSTPQQSCDGSLSPTWSLDDNYTAVHESHNSQCHVNCDCEMGLGENASYAYDPYYDDSGGEHR